MEVNNMRKKIIVNIVVIVYTFLIVVNLSALDYVTDKNTFITNQEKIISSSLKGIGNILIKIDQGGEIISYNMQKNIEFYSKGKDKIKTIINSEDEMISILQYANQRYQLSSNSDNIIASTVNVACDMYKIYFLLNLEVESSNEEIVHQEIVVEDGVTLNKYIISYNNPCSSDCNSQESYLIDSSHIYFNQNGMIVKKVDYSNEDIKKIVTVSYILVEGIYIALTIVTQQFENSVIFENSVLYSDIQVNVDIDDSIFQL